MTDKKGKSARFTDAMNRVLIEEYGKHQVVLKSKFSNTVTNDRKRQLWEEITVAVNAVNSTERKSVEQVKKRWEDITTSVKKKDRVARQTELKRIKVTGNGNLPDDEESSEFLQSPVLPAINVMSSPDRQVATILGPQVFEGITGGFDTFDSLGWNDHPASTGVTNDPFLQETLEQSAMKARGIPSCNEGLNSQPGCSKDMDVIEMSAKGSENKRRRKISLADAQVEYFEVATKYYKLKMKKVELEIQALQNKEE